MDNLKKNSGSPILYLDYDGVLHHEDVYFMPGRGAFYKNALLGPLFAYLPILEGVLADLPDVRIVLSTSWVRYRTFKKARERLSSDLRERVIGATFHSEMIRSDTFYSPYGGNGSRRISCSFDYLSRHQAIVSDVSRRGCQHWLAIDDDIDRWPESQYDRIVITQGHLGLSEAGKADELHRRLKDLCKLAKRAKAK